MSPFEPPPPEPEELPGNKVGLAALCTVGLFALALLGVRAFEVGTAPPRARPGPLTVAAEIGRVTRTPFGLGESGRDARARASSELARWSLATADAGYARMPIDVAMAIVADGGADVERGR